MQPNNPPIVAIAGRPNVGKSTLMNRILGKRKAIVEKTPGITRDKRVEEANWQGYDFHLLDMGGWSSKHSLESMDIEAEVSKMALAAIKESDLVIMLVDGKAGVTQNDSDLAKTLIKLGKPTLLAVNKVDVEKHKDLIWDFISLGLGEISEPFPISAMHGRGVADLLDCIVQTLFLNDEINTDEIENEPIHTSTPEDFSVVIVGRPNAGKSTLFNQIVGTQRSIESPIPGTTRDPVDTLLETEVGIIRFVDTAGLRRKSKMNERAEYYSMLRALESVDRSDIALLVIDSKEGVTHQDQRLAERIDSAGCPILVLLNKWDLCSTDEKLDLPEQVGRRLHFFKNAPLLRVSALKGAGMDELIPALAATLNVYKKRVSTKEVNNVIAMAQAAHSPKGGGRVLYAAQVASDPPTFTLFVSRKLPATYLRYLERELRSAFEFENTPIKIRVKQRK